MDSRRVGLLIIVLIVGSSLGYGLVSFQYSPRIKEYETLLGKYENISGTYNSLSEKYEVLSNQYEKLLYNYETLTHEYQTFLNSTQQKAIKIRGIPIKGFEWYGSSQGQINEDLRSYEKIRDLGANWVQLVLWELVTDDGELLDYSTSIYDQKDIENQGGIEIIRKNSQKTEELMSTLVNHLHEKGYHVFLITYHERMGAHHEYGSVLDIDIDSFLIDAANQALKWASFCEEHNVEMFAPRKEFQGFVGNEKALQWDNLILPKIREVYSGDLVRGAFTLIGWNEGMHYAVPQYELSMNMSGWDYLGLDFYGNGVDTLEELESMYARFIAEAKKLKDTYGLKGIIFEELGTPHTGDEAFWFTEYKTVEEVFNEIHQMYFECGNDVIDGFFPWGWNQDYLDFIEDGSRSFVNLKGLITYYYSSSEILKREATPVEMASIFYSEDSFIAFKEEEKYIELDSWSNWELCKAGPPEVRVVTVEQGGYINLTNMGIHPHEKLDSGKWRNYIFRGRFKVVSGILLIDFRISADSRYCIHIHPIATILFTKCDEEGISEYILDGNLMLIELDEWYAFDIIVKDDYLFISIEDMTLVYRDPHPIIFGSINIGGTSQDNSQILLDDLSVSSIS